MTDKRVRRVPELVVDPLAELGLLALERSVLVLPEILPEPVSLEEGLAVEGDVTAEDVPDRLGDMLVDKVVVHRADEPEELVGEVPRLPLWPDRDDAFADADWVVCLVDLDEFGEPVGLSDDVVAASAPALRAMLRPSSSLRATVRRIDPSP